MPERIFFQTSLPRAGSTLLQNLIGQNPDFYVTPTSGVLELLYGARANFSSSPEFKAQEASQMKRAFLNFCRQGLEGFYEALTDRPYVLDKSRGWGVHYRFVDQFYPQPKMICLIRDLRDVYASMEQKFREHAHLDTGLEKHAELRGTTTAKRIDLWSSGIPVGLALDRLQQLILDRTLEQLLVIRYEDLLRNPQLILDRIYDYLGVPRFEHDFGHIEQLTQEDDTVYGIFGDHQVQSKLTPRPSRAREVLGAELCQRIYTNYRWFYDRFGYAA
jgi:sulfotransferase